MAEEENYDEDNGGYYEEELPEPVYEVSLSPSDSEKRNILAFALELRNESTFCDVAFLVKGSLFRAHRVIVASWSRWLRALLSEGPDDEVVCLDMFTTEAFSMILDYMYGKPLLFKVDNAENIFKVLRRLEMQQLEQQCWCFLLGCIDSTNCERLHELADVFDCPPLKLCAWKILQESIPGYSIPANLEDGEEGKIIVSGNGLTGPCDMYADDSNHQGGDGGYDDDDDEDGNSRFPTILLMEKKEDERMARYEAAEANGDNMEDYEDDQDYDENESDNDMTVPLHPIRDGYAIENPSASDVVNAWAKYLKYMYGQCHSYPSYTENYEGDIEVPEETVKRYVENRQYRHQRGQHNEDEGTQMESSVNDGNEKSNSNRTKSSRWFGLGGGTTTSEQPAEPQAATPKSPGRGVRDSPGRHPNRAMQMGRGHMSDTTIDWYAELRRFYTGVGMPGKVSELPGIMQSWKGKESLMLDSLIKKYEESIPQELMGHLKRLQKAAAASAGTQD